MKARHALMLLLACSALTGCWNVGSLPPYPATFKIDWDEEVQVTDTETAWVHRSATYLRKSSWAQWDARKVAETLSFGPTPRSGPVSFEVELGSFGGIERTGNDWVISYAGTKLEALRIGTCMLRGRGPCVLVVRGDGSVYKPSNTSEVLINFYPLLRCRTTAEDCFQRFNDKRVTLVAKES